MMNFTHVGIIVHEGDHLEVPGGESVVADSDEQVLLLQVQERRQRTQRLVAAGSTRAQAQHLGQAGQEQRQIVKQNEEYCCSWAQAQHLGQGRAGQGRTSVTGLFGSFTVGLTPQVKP
jgi:hypothetical protein